MCFLLPFDDKFSCTQVVHAHSSAGEEPETKVLLFGGFGGEAGSLRFFGDLLCFDPCDLGGNRRKRNRCVDCAVVCVVCVVCVMCVV